MTSYGKNIDIRVFGGSHDEEIGVRVSKLPAGIKIDLPALLAFMKRRAPGNNKHSTSRSEPDTPVFVSGVDDKLTTNGDEFCAVIKNTNAHSSDYSTVKRVPRPSHADYCAVMKYGENVDLRGGGHFSGRLTAPLCILGGILKNELKKKNIKIAAHILSIGAEHDRAFDALDPEKKDFSILGGAHFPVLDEAAGERMRDIIEKARLSCDSVGGKIECAVNGLPVGVGEHMFSGMESRISSIMFSVPAVKGIFFGESEAASMYGSEYNDPFYTDGKSVFTKTNHCGGIQGGMTNGMPLIFTVSVKPTPSIAKKQQSVDLFAMENTDLQIKGRHDPCIVPRAVPVIEAAAAIAIYDALLDESEPEV